MKFNSLLLKIIFGFLTIITIIYSYLIFSELINISDYSYNELFINYKFGFVRRGLLGQIFLFFNDFFNSDPKLFFLILFTILYLVQIYLFFSIFRNLFENIYLALLILLSPSLILFNIYDPNIFFVKDIFVKISILIHAYLSNLCMIDKNYNKYQGLLKYFIIPLLIIVTLIHEYQIFFIGAHILISLGFARNKQNVFSIFKIYSPLIIIFILLIFFIGNENQYYLMNEYLNKFNVTLHPQLKGGIYTAIGGFYKWHFHYFTYIEFIELFLSIILGLIIFYVLFEILLNKNVIVFNSPYQKKTLIYFIPSLIIFVLAHIDHGRNIALISVNLIVFYSTLKLNMTKLKEFTNKKKKNILQVFFFLTFLFFYIFMWKLDQYAGYSMRGQANTIFESSLFSEFIKFVNFLYYYIDNNLFNLPDLNL